MLFVEFRFLAFFGLVLAISWGLRRNGARKAFLLLASYAFYAAWDWRFLGLILLSTVVDGVAGRRIHEAPLLRQVAAWIAYPPTMIRPVSFNRSER